MFVTRDDEPSLTVGLLPGNAAPRRVRDWPIG